MRKLITLLAAATLVASSFAMAETTGNANDPLQQVQPTGTGEAPTTLADADTSSASGAMTPDSSTDAAKPAMKHHKKHHMCKHHCNKHHHKKKPASTAETAPTTTPATTDTASTPAAQ